MSETTVHPWDTCTVADRDHRHGHELVAERDAAPDFDLLDCADIEFLSTVLCHLAEPDTTPDVCPLLRSVIVSINQLVTDDPVDAIAYWQGKIDEWFEDSIVRVVLPLQDVSNRS